MEVLINNLQGLPIDARIIRQLAAFLLEKEHVDTPSELSVAFVDERRIKELNLKYRGVNESTDVLAFSFNETALDKKVGRYPSVILGDVIICPEVARRYASKYGNSLHQELCLLLIHGILHLLGFDHQSAKDEKIMKQREEEILKSFFTRLRKKPWHV